MAGEIIKAGNVLKIGQRIEFFVDNDDNRYASRYSYYNNLIFIH